MPLQEQDDLCALMCVCKSVVSEAVKFCRDGKVLITAKHKDRRVKSLAFKPPSAWRVSIRGGEGFEAERRRADKKLDDLAEQYALKLFEVDEELAEAFIKGKPKPGSNGPESKPPVRPPRTAAPSSPTPTCRPDRTRASPTSHPHTYVTRTGTSNTFNGPRPKWSRGEPAQRRARVFHGQRTQEGA